MFDVATRGRRVDRSAGKTASTDKPKAHRTSGRNLTCSEFAELFPVHCATWERERGQSDGDLVQSYRPWDWWLTITFRDVVSATFALSLFKEWARDLARDRESHITLAVGMELQGRGAPHFHALLHVHENADAFDARRAERRWRELSKRCGVKNKFEPFDPERRGGDYLTKDGGWGFLVACPRRPTCRRRHGCRVDPNAW
ncbi:MAG: hypothetical protein KF819_37275 [Labilithrix sp.]|nr:hypothetical protein [Labilithrix sp.]